MRMKIDHLLDAAGNTVLVGLTFNETVELQLLDEMETVIAALIPPGACDVGAPARRKRWQELYGKHIAARIVRSAPPNTTMH